MRIRQFLSVLIYFLYRTLEFLLFPLVLLYLLYRGVRDRRYLRGLPERFGFLEDPFHPTAPGAVWLHAVSVGETLSAVELLRRLREEFPSVKLYVSSTTVTGRSLAEEKLQGLADGVFYAPLDYAGAVRRVLRSLRPAVVVVMETEIWPNLYREPKRWGCQLLIANGRISDRAFARYRRLRWFFRAVLRWPDAILTQNELASRRYLRLGALAERVRTIGNLKYDFRPPAAPPEALREFLQNTRPEHVWIAASTMPPWDGNDPDEDDLVISAFRDLAASHSGLLLILAPRRPERFDVAARKLERAGVHFVRRSGLAKLALPGVLLLDSMGELSALFPYADVVFIGGTIARRGGHNILEPAFAAKPIVVGPHMENFPDIAAQFKDAGAMREIGDGAELATAVESLLGDATRRAELGARAKSLAEEKRGATERAAAEILHAWSEALPQAPRSALARILLWLFALTWEQVSRFKRAKQLARRETLRAPVISIGGITMGGVGKTPTTLWLAAKFREHGKSAAILTRGYRRRYPEEATLVAAGAACPFEVTGDEAQILVRSGLASVGIGADRAFVGRLLEQRFHPDVILLDDGYQHARIARQADIVLIDAQDPFGGGDVFPLGRLREPLEALSRAHVFIITRSEKGRPPRGLERRLRERNRAALICHARTRPMNWVDAHTGETWPAPTLPFRSVAAFCGLGNPGSFWRTLERLGHQPRIAWAFADHTHYRPQQIKRLVSQAKSAGATALLTTEKDLMNLDEQALALFAPLRLCWLSIGVEVDEEEELHAMLKRLTGL